jgi:hypothetical protein
MEDAVIPPSPESQDQRRRRISGSPTLSSSSGYSFSFPSEMTDGIDDEDLFWTAGSSGRGQGVFSPLTPKSPALRLRHCATDVGQGSPTKAGGIPIELALFSDDDEGYSTPEERTNNPESRLDRTPTQMMAGGDGIRRSLTRHGRGRTISRTCGRSILVSTAFTSHSVSRVWISCYVISRNTLMAVMMSDVCCRIPPSQFPLSYTLTLT